MDAEQLKERLLAPSSVASLATLWVDHLFAQRLSELLPRDRVRRVLRDGVEGWLSQETSQVALDRMVQETARALRQQIQPLDTKIPSALQQGMRRWLERPWSPSRKISLAMLDHPPVRALIRKLLLDAIIDFGRALRAPVEGVARGLSGLAKLAAERSGALGSLVGAVGGEVERQLDRRASEFVDAALSGIIQKLVDELSNPARQPQQAALRVAVLEGLLSLSTDDLAAELVAADVVGGTQSLRDALRVWLAQPSGEAELQAVTDWLLAQLPPVSLGEWLEQQGLAVTVRRAVEEAVTAHLNSLWASPAFMGWLSRILE